MSEGAAPEMPERKVEARVTSRVVTPKSLGASAEEGDVSLLCCVVCSTPAYTHFLAS